MHTETKQEKDKGACAWHVLMMSQRTKEGGMGIYKRGFLGIMREAQRGITTNGTPTIKMQNTSKSISQVNTVQPKPVQSCTEARQCNSRD